MCDKKLQAVPSTTQLTAATVGEEDARVLAPDRERAEAREGEVEHEEEHEPQTVLPGG